MRRSAFHAFLMAAMATVASLGATTAQAQHRCVEGGRIVHAQTSCERHANDTEIVRYGPSWRQAQMERVPNLRTVPSPSQTTSQPAVPRHTRYLSPECERISEALRTGPSRGVQWPVMRALRDEYSAKCSEQESEAQQRAYQDQLRQREDRERERAAIRQVSLQREQDAQQCAAMRDTWQVKKQRRDRMTPGEVDAFQQFEARFLERCGRH